MLGRGFRHQTIKQISQVIHMFPSIHASLFSFHSMHGGTLQMKMAIAGKEDLYGNVYRHLAFFLSGNSDSRGGWTFQALRTCGRLVFPQTLLLESVASLRASTYLVSTSFHQITQCLSDNIFWTLSCSIGPQTAQISNSGLG